jgi:hypothetical protein
MAVITEKPNPLPQNCVEPCVGLHISSVGYELTANSPSLIEESSDFLEGSTSRRFLL